MTEPLVGNDARSPWHAATPAEVAAWLETDPEVGLAGREARGRLESHGPNELASHQEWVRIKRLAGQFQDVLIWLLLGAAATSGFVLRAWVDAIAIGAIVVLNAAIGYAQESKAHSALARLRDLGAPSATVVRDGRIDSVATASLVPGDVVLVEAGDRVPADARVVEAVRLFADEATLTGESLPVAKIEDETPPEADVSDRTSMLHAGTTVVSGRGRAIVTSTGMSTEVGRIAALFSDGWPKTPLQVELGRIGRRLAVVAAVAAVLIFGVGVARSFPVETMVLTAVALAVAAIPEGLPAVITVSLAGGLQRLAHRNAIVRRLPAVETLGAVDVICTDKTGTLTASKLEVTEVVTADGRQGIRLISEGSDAIRWLVACATLCNDAQRSSDGWDGDPTEIALLSAMEQAGEDADRLGDRYPRVDEAGFDGRRKRMSTLHSAGDHFVLLVKGAPEVIIARSASMATLEGREELTEQRRARSLEQADRLAGEGMRTLAFALRHLDQRPGHPEDEERDLCLLGMVGLREQIRPEVRSAVSRAAKAGVRTVMVTGDHATTAKAIADAVGIGGGKLMDGNELSHTTVEALTGSIGDYRVFSRVDPTDKVKIIEAWQSVGAKVAMTGDGVNDAPALHRADIGVAMGSGTDVAREAASMVLTDDNYATIVAAIAEGRRLFSNLRNVVHYLLSANASEVIYVLLGFLAFGFLGEPLLAVQLLWINLISDALPAIALGMDKPTRDLMEDRPGQGRDVLSPRNMVILLTQGLILAGAAVLTMTVGAFVMDLDQSTIQTMVFTTLVFSQLLHALNVRAGDDPRILGRARRPGPLMVTALLGSGLLHVAVVYSPLGNTFLRAVPLSIQALGLTLAASILSMIGVRILNRAIPR